MYRVVFQSTQKEHIYIYITDVIYILSPALLKVKSVVQSLTLPEDLYFNMSERNLKGFWFYQTNKQKFPQASADEFHLKQKNQCTVCTVGAFCHVQGNNKAVFMIISHLSLSCLFGFVHHLLLTVDEKWCSRDEHSQARRLTENRIHKTFFADLNGMEMLTIKLW